jgi:MATE family multidrug resistance protein
MGGHGAQMTLRFEAGAQHKRMQRTLTAIDTAILRKLLGIALPMVISQGAFALMIFTARWFLAQLSSAHMAAAMGGGAAWYFSFALFSGILAYANALVAQYRGAQEVHKCSKVVTQGLLLVLGCIPLLVVIAVGMRQLFAAMGHTPQQVLLEQQYYDVLMLASVLMLIKAVLSSFFSGSGRAQVVMCCEVAGICVNVPLAWMLIFGKLGLPALAMQGAALATVLSTAFTLACYLAFYLAPRNRRQYQVAASLVLDTGILRRYLRLGLPSGLELFLNVAAFNLFLLMFHAYGITEAAAATIIFNWDVLSFVPLLGLNVAVMSLVGHAVGARDMGSTQAVTNAGYLLGVGYSMTLALLFLVFRHRLVEFFIFDEAGAAAIRELAGYMMIGLSFYVLIEGILQVAAGVLRGAGDTQWCMRASVSLHWLMLVLQYCVIEVLGLGPRVSWLLFVGMVFCIVLAFLWRLRGSQWRSAERLQAVMAER